MRHWIIRRLRKWLLWLDPEVIIFAAPDSRLFSRALTLVREIEPAPQSGEWKRHQVYARLLKEFPEMAHGIIGLVIEHANQVK